MIERLLRKRGYIKKDSSTITLEIEIDGYEDFLAKMAKMEAAVQEFADECARLGGNIGAICDSFSITRNYNSFFGARHKLDIPEQENGLAPQMKIEDA